MIQELYPLKKKTQLHKTPAAAAAAAELLQSWPTLCDPIDGSPPGFPVPVPGILLARTLARTVKSLSRVRLLATPWTAAYHGIFQARVLEWGAIAFSAIRHLTPTKCSIVLNTHFIKDTPTAIHISKMPTH